MLEVAQGGLSTVAVWSLVVTSCVAGIVYGFAGFGAALIFMPVAVVVLPPEMAIAAFSVSALASFVTVYPRAVSLVDRRAVSVLVLCATVTASAGLWVLRHTDVTAIRWGVVSVCAITLLAMLSGWRYGVSPRLRMQMTIGGAAGFVGGVSGLLGPIMVLFQLAGPAPVAITRATTLVFLTTTSLLLLPLMALQGLLTREACLLGAVLLIPYGAGTLLGQGLFQPQYAQFYRKLAYGMIALATGLGLPLWDGMGLT